MKKRNNRDLEKLIESERQAHKIQQAALAGRLKRSNAALKEQRDAKHTTTHSSSSSNPKCVANSFIDEPICQSIIKRVKEGGFKSKIPYTVYKDFALDKQQLMALRSAVNRHFCQFTTRLKTAFPKLNESDLDYCCLYLLGLSDADISALMQRSYNTVTERNKKLKRIIGCENVLSDTLISLANDVL